MLRSMESTYLNDSENGEVMSEIHVGCPPNSSGPYISNFTISIPSDVDHGRNKDLFKVEEVCRHDQMIHVDEDGDLLLTRRTSLEGRADRGDEILDNCASNVQLNSEVLNYRSAIYVRELDWMNSWPPISCLRKSADTRRFSWTPAEVEEAEGVSLLVAADVIYSDDLTDALFSILERFMSSGSEKILYLALEKRYNFSIDDLDVVANGYSHFLSYLMEDKDLEYGSSPCFLGKQIDISLVPQYVREYDRGKDVELWQIKYSRRKPELKDSCE